MADSEAVQKTSWVHFHVPKWIDDNNKFFLPPVCNKMMHGEGQLKVFYVGGPNVRKDFHLEEGEELFYQRKGDMKLIILEGGKFRDVPIKEGEVFLLPGRIPHSPQRYEDTVGLVIERERMKDELDALRYFVEGSTEILFEKWLYCEDLGTQLGPVIQEYFDSEQHKTGKPVPGTITSSPPFLPDDKRCVEGPFSLKTWLDRHRDQITEEGSRRLFDESYQSDVVVYGQRDQPVSRKLDNGEVWLWQLEGRSKVVVDGEELLLDPDDCLLVRAGASFQHRTEKDSFLMSVVMDPSKKDRGLRHLKNDEKKETDEPVV